MPPKMATQFQATETDTCATQTELTCPPSKNVSLQTKQGLRTSASQTDIPSPQPPAKPTVSLVASTQTDIVASSRNENLEVLITPLAGSGIVPQQQPISEPTESEVAVNASNGDPRLSTPAPKDSSMQVTSDAHADVGLGVKANLISNLEEQKKRELLATLKAMDAQKDPPASQPISSTATKSTAQPTSDELVGGGKPPVGKLEKQSTQPPTTSQPANDGEEEAKRKKLLLAKLMAIDEGNDPNKVTMSKVNVSKVQPSGTKLPSGGNQSTTSVQSWPETVENMYQGKPAFATNDNQFGSRHSSGRRGASTKSRDFFLTGGGGVGEVSSPKNKRHGRRQLEQKQSSTLNFNNDAFSTKVGDGDGKVGTKAAERESRPTAPTAELGYQPTFGRRAGAARQTNRQKPKNGMIFGDFDDSEPSVAAAKKRTEPPSSLTHNFEASESNHGTRKDYPWEDKVNVSSNSQGSAGESVIGKRETRSGSNETDAGPLSSPSMVFGYVGQEKPLLQSRSKGSLLPLRGKAVHGSLIAATVDITEPDDLEELAL